MTVGKYTLSPEEEGRVLAIYEQLKVHFPSAELDFREEIIGIGEEGRYRFCYFALREGELRVKFKHRSWLSLDDEAAIERDITATVARFRATEMTLPKRRRREKAREKTAASQPTYRPQMPEITKEAPPLYEEMLQLCKEALANIPNDKTNTGFDRCSPPLRRALHHSFLFSVEELYNRFSDEAITLPRIGSARLRELCGFLLTLVPKEVCLSEAAKEIRQRTEAIDYLQTAQREAPVLLGDIPLGFEAEGDYHSLYVELISHIDESASIKLRPREQAILRARLGIGEPAKDLEEIGDAHGVTRECIRQLVKKATRKMGYKLTSNDTLLQLESRKIGLVTRIAERSAGGFLSYLLAREECPAFIQFVCDAYLRTEIDLPTFKRAFKRVLARKTLQRKQLESTRCFNDEIYGHIIFPAEKRPITDGDFERLKTKGATSDRDLAPPDLFPDEEPPKGADPEQRLLQKLLESGTFKDIAAKALKIPFRNNFFYQDLQCLTHEGTLVLIEVESVFNMGNSTNMERFRMLREYCERYGFGYLITDGRGNSFEHLNEENAAFSAAVLAEIDRCGWIGYPRYREIYSETQATQKHLLALIKNHKLHLSRPFTLKRTLS